VKRYIADVRSRWRDTSGPYRAYWNKYGGVESLLRSPYFICSIALVCITFGTWSSPDWFSQPLEILPNIIGFSLGALTIFLGFGNEKFRDLISGDTGRSENASPYVQATTTFVHFILVQCVSLLLALVIKAFYSFPIPQWVVRAVPLLVPINDVVRLRLWAVGYWLFMYAITLVLSAVISMFQLAGLFDKWRTSQRSIEKRDKLREIRKSDKLERSRQFLRAKHESSSGDR
jgi:hypothetical protein